MVPHGARVWVFPNVALGNSNVPNAALGNLNVPNATLGNFARFGRWARVWAGCGFPKSYRWVTLVTLS